MASGSLMRTEIDPGINLVKALDQSDFGLVAAFWSYDSDLDRWRMTVAYDGPQTDRSEKQRQAIDVRADWRDAHPDQPILDFGSVTVTSSEDPLVAGLRPMTPMNGVGEKRISNRVVNGIYLEDAIIHRMAA